MDEVTEKTKVGGKKSKGAEDSGIKTGFSEKANILSN